ncbi:hypothetical protein Tcan_10944 [Toxocara canis]|uniref:Uncharacterized protein n=1 Tax=Toxocara canis TaxID=6265 RepID=A0A0B2V6Z7_TOXCA|nr:hypothetical protein Tcan_10944 [Toxocara canis]
MNAHTLTNQCVKALSRHSAAKAASGKLADVITKTSYSGSSCSISSANGILERYQNRTLYKYCYLHISYHTDDGEGRQNPHFFSFTIPEQLPRPD